MHKAQILKEDKKQNSGGWYTVLQICRTSNYFWLFVHSLLIISDKRFITTSYAYTAKQKWSAGITGSYIYATLGAAYIEHPNHRKSYGSNIIYNIKKYGNTPTCIVMQYNSVVVTALRTNFSQDTLLVKNH